MSERNRNRILVGDVREQLATLPDESVHCVVTSPPLNADLIEDGSAGVARFHFVGDGIGADRAAHVSASNGDASDLAALLHFTERHAVQSLFALDAEVGQQGRQNLNSPLVGAAPTVQRSAALSVRIFHSHVAAERRGEQVDGFARDLANVDALAVYRRTGVTSNSHGVSAALDAYRSVRIEYACEVSKNG